MSWHTLARRAALSAALAALFTTAAVTAAALDETTIYTRNNAGAIDSVAFTGELAPGETRALTTRSGAAAVITRSEAGVTLDLGGERFELPGLTDDIEVLADVGVDVDVALDGHAHGDRITRREIVDDTSGAAGADAHRIKHKVVIRHAGDHASALADADAKADGGEPRVEKRIVLRHAHEGDDFAALGDDPDAMNPEAMLAQADGKRVIVMRRRHLAEAGITQ